ncbi:MAG: hypothetical protein HQL72_03985 [Magnetococcales bacterium]|nr:hypothetical protein [Magnetococcales bacterium]
MKTKIVTDLATDQAVVLSGPGAIKVSAAKSVTVSKAVGSKAGFSQMGSMGTAKLGSAIHVLSPFFGFALLSAGALLLVKQWIKKVDNGECQ